MGSVSIILKAKSAANLSKRLLSLGTWESENPSDIIRRYRRQKISSTWRSSM
jgi:hypothetical protein